eukprot:evm.model.NODE_11205_length_5553_cov_28.928867.1
MAVKPLERPLRVPREDGAEREAAFIRLKEREGRMGMKAKEDRASRARQSKVRREEVAWRAIVYFQLMGCCVVCYVIYGGGMEGGDGEVDGEATRE